MEVILDTNALSALIDGDDAIADKLREVHRPFLPVIVLGEFRFGILGSRNRKAYDGWLKENLESFNVLPIEATTSIHYASIRVGLKSRGTPIPDNDIWIAALGSQHRQAILTRDHHFTLIEEVRFASW